MQRPEQGEYGSFNKGYVDAAPEGDVLDVLREQGRELVGILSSVDEPQSLFRYAPGKWSIKELVGHLADAERVWTYRAMRIARGDKTPLPGYEQDDFVANASFDEKPYTLLVEDLVAARAATISFFETVSAEESVRAGTASDAPVSVRALAHIIAGHERHHIGVLRERYLG